MRGSTMALYAFPGSIRMEYVQSASPLVKDVIVAKSRIEIFNEG